VWVTEAGHFSWPVRVYYEDTDSGGVVYYANYLKFLERARTEWLRHLGFDQARLASERGLLFAVREVHLDLRRPARLDDRLQVTVDVAERRGASLLFDQAVTREGDADLLCHGRVRVACLAADGFRPRPLPDDLLAEIAR
jgi:acyl-CoA thioester hydrolase